MKAHGAGPRDVLAMAHDLRRRADPATAGLWPRASALLARQALEAGVHQFWERRAVDLGGYSMQAQLICLRTYLGDAELAARTSHAWSALSRACHHHSYELAPTSTELEAWFSVVEELVERVGADQAEDTKQRGSPCD